jgi:hypothetical protein
MVKIRKPTMHFTSQNIGSNFNNYQFQVGFKVWPTFYCDLSTILPFTPYFDQINEGTP